MRHFIKLFLLAALTLPGVTLAQGLQTSTKQTAAERSGNADAQTDVSALQLLQAEWAKSPVGTEDVDRIPRATTSSKTTSPLTIAATRQPANAPAPRKADSNAPAVFVQTDVAAEDVVCSSTSNSSPYLPVYANYFEQSNTESQWIYPSTYFTRDNGIFKDVPEGSTIKINSIKFHAASNTITSYVSEATVEVRIGETDATTVSRDTYTNNLTVMGNPVFTGHLACSGQEMTIKLDKPYTYTGKNLILDIKIKQPASYYANCYWYGVSTSTNCGYCYGSSQQQGIVRFLPMMTVSYTYTTWAPTEEIDFGTVIVGGNKQISAYINDPGDEATVNLSTGGVFGVSPETLPSGGKYDFTLSFTPDAATNYTGKLQLSLNGLTANVDMKGIGSIPGTPATRDSSFFAGIEYTWPINIEESFRPEDNKATLDQIATDPDQIIALLREVYVNKSVPGNYTRGFTEGGLPETSYPDVAYTGVGTIEHSGSNYNTGYSYADGYGWNVPGDVITGSAFNDYIRYAHMDSTQYKPDVEGLTLLLVEMRDDYTTAKMQEYVRAQNPSTDYEELKAYISYAIKSVRVITQAMRTGEGFNAGILFKIDCDKMNKFYLIAKGQLRYPFNSNRVFSGDNGLYTDLTFCRLPLYAYSPYLYYLGNSNNGHGGFLDYNCGDVFGAHMFEQFSPYNLTEANSVTDIYADLVGMNSFSVPHDCVAVPAATPAATPAGGHFFRMYGDDVDINKCQDVRDMMFFIPDYRMMYFADHEVTVRRPVIVADGKAEGTTAGTNKYVPVYSTKYNRQGSYAQLIYPASMLDTLSKVDKPIRSITFHPGSTTAFGSGQMMVKMGETGLSSFGENPSRLSLTNYVEATITPTLGDNKLTITFANPYSYQGGNLLIDLEVTTPGTAGEMVWNGIVTTDNQAIDYNIDDAGTDNKVWPVKFLPAITFTYEEQTTESRDTGTGTLDDGTTVYAQSVKYQNYHPDHRPKMGLYIIKQDPVTCPENCQTDNYYKLTLTWDSNMDEFLPGKKQKYYLLQLVQDEFGKDKYIPVYKTNEEGKYWNAKTSEWQDDTIGAERVVLTNIAPSNDKKTYTEVYVKRQSGSQQVTYAIQGCDMDDFLTLQISNQQSYIVPGTDPAEMMLLGDATYYSRYNAQTQRNCYSNKMVVKSNPRMIRKEYVQEGTQLTLKRVSTAGEEVVATAVVQSMPTTDDSGKMLVTLYNQSDKTEYPTGKSDNPVVNYAGYHANSGKDLEIDDEGRTTWKHSFFEYTEGEFSYINLGELEIYDNFVVDVSENNHPRQYIYTMEFTTAAEIVGKEGAYQAYSNSHRVPVYQTDSRVNPPLTKQQVLDDTDMKDDYKARDIAFEEQVELSSKTEIYRYDAYRWPSENSDEFYTFDKVKGYDVEVKITPNGTAGNQGQSYTVSMNDVNSDDNYTGSVNVSQENQQAWAKFVDKYPTSDAAEASAYTYAPVVELFSTGVDMTGTAMRADYNTYGGPQQKTAVGKLDIEFVTDGDGKIEASEDEWEMNDETYCYYNMPIKFKVFGVPTDYEVYKVRAWRQVDTSLLGERPEDVEHNVPDRSDRIRPNYLFEELTYGQEFDRDGGVSAVGLQSYEFGNRPRAYRPDGTPIETWATFGALKLSDKAEMKVNVVARVYFTKKNIDAAMNGTGAPRRVLTADNLSADGKYYVIEKSIEMTLNADNIITAVGTVRADCEPVSVTYVNALGQQSSRPFSGVNIVVTRYSDGTTTTQKVIR